MTLGLLVLSLKSMIQHWVISGDVVIPLGNSQLRVLPLPPGKVSQQQWLLSITASGRYMNTLLQPYLGYGEAQPTASKL